MSDPTPEPQPTPTPDLAPPAEPTELEKFVESLAGFDPAAITGRLDDLLNRVDNAPVVEELRNALTDGFTDLSKQIKDLGKLLKQQPPPPESDPSGSGGPGTGAPPPPPPAPAAPAPGGGGIAETLFGVPVIGGSDAPSQ